MCKVLDFVFDDKRVAILFVMVWQCIVLSIFYEIGVLHGEFMTMGPSENTIFMSVPINSWYRYSLVAGFTFVNTCVNDFMGDAISPWLVNTMTDHKCKYIPYSKVVCISISQMWGFYCNIMGVFTVFLSLTQIDFVLIRTVADFLMSMYTNVKFLENKVYDPIKYHAQDNGECGIELVQKQTAED